MEDRTPKFPGRVELVPVEGQPNVYDLIRRDQPTQTGTALGKGTLLDDDTAALLELPAPAATVNNALKTLALPPGKFAVKVSVLTPGGGPMEGVTVEGIETLSGGACVTNAVGSVLGFCIKEQTTLSVKSDCIDFAVATVSKSVSLEPGKINTAALQFARATATSKLFTVSAHFSLSVDVSDFDCSAMGGGQNGDYGWLEPLPVGYTRAYGGNGGNAGRITNTANIENSAVQYFCTIGGVGPTQTTLSEAKTQSIVVTSSTGQYDSGGRGAYADYYGYSSTPGAYSAKFKYPPSPFGGSGGGGGAGYGGQNNVYTNGSNGGGTGGAGGSIISYPSLSAGAPASSYGAGGGGGAYYAEFDTGSGSGGSHIYPAVSSAPGIGKQGVLGLVWRYA